MKTGVKLGLFAVLLTAITLEAADPKTKQGVLRYDGKELRERLRLSDPGDSKVERIATRALENLSRTMNLRSVKLKISDGDDIFAHPESGIVVGRNKLKSILSQSDVHQYEKIILFILAHEMGHHRQFVDYGKDHVLDASVSQRRIYECQADVLAGKYLVEAFSRFDWNRDEETSNELSAEEKNAMIDAFQVAFDLGDETASLGDHPSKSVRRRAVQLGMAHGMMTRWQAMPRVPLLPDPARPEAILKLRVNVENNESAKAWSLRQAWRLSHESGDLLEKVELSSKRVELVNRFMPEYGGLVPVYEFVLEYRNQGSKDVQLDLEVGTYLLDRDNPDDLKKRLKGDCLNVKPKIPAHGTQTVWGRLPAFIYGIDDVSLKPKLVFFPDEMSLISAKVDSN